MIDKGEMVICWISLEKGTSMLNKAVEDKYLTEYVKEYKIKLESERIEIFEHKGNTLATENGYYCAFWESDLEKA